MVWRVCSHELAYVVNLFLKLSIWSHHYFFVECVRLIFCDTRNLPTFVRFLHGKIRARNCKLTKLKQQWSIVNGRIK